MKEFMLSIPDWIGEYLDKCKNSLGNLNGRLLKKHLTDEIDGWFRDNGLSPYFVVENMTEDGYVKPMVCPECGKRINVYGIVQNRKHIKYCSVECGKSARERNKKKTCLEKYGAEYPLQSKQVQEKILKTVVEKYGVRSTTLVPEVRAKQIETIKKRLGVECPLQSESVREKIKKTNLDRYGVENPMQDSNIQQKAVQTNIEKYGVENPSQRKDVAQKKVRSRRENFYKSFVGIIKSNRNLSVLSDKDEYVSGQDVLYRCDTCGTEFRSESRDTQKTFCPVCYGARYSKKEKDVLDYIKSFYSGLIIENDRKTLGGKEIDIWIPDLKLGIEFDGTYCHSGQQKGSGYHQEKTLLARSLGIRLVHIFEHEWDRNPELLKRYLKDVFGIYDRKIYARKCVVRKIPYKDYSEFLEENHLQGTVRSPVRYGLFYGSELVSVIGFGKSRFKKDEVELHRYCVKSGALIPGGFSKLIAHSGIDEFVSYVDLTHFSGQGYEKLGFEVLGVTTPSYVYVGKDGYVLNRYQCQKHKLKGFLDMYDETLSEKQNMLLNGYNIVYDCGNLKVLHKHS